jgi:murein DD-endopeptidase MepM/ murein hydrolase activator NlpD
MQGPSAAIGQGGQVRTRVVERREVTRPKTQAGIALPYSLARVISDFGDCRAPGKRHQGLDIAAAMSEPDAGLGTPIRAMVRAKVTAIALPDEDTTKYSTFDRSPGTTIRRGRALPRSGDVPGYGRVYFFTQGYGASRTGVMVETVGQGGALDGYRVRYMHMSAIHPTLRVGDVLEPGQELGLMGGTAVQDSSPHLHIDIEDPSGQRIDPAPLLGLPRAEMPPCAPPVKAGGKPRK